MNLKPFFKIKLVLKVFFEFPPCLAAVGHAHALLRGERVALVAPGARLRALALCACVRAVAALSTGKRIGPLWMTMSIKLDCFIIFVHGGPSGCGMQFVDIK